MRIQLSTCLLGLTVAAACADSPLDRSIGELGGGWEYNNARWNSALDHLIVGPPAPYGVAGPNTLDPYTNVVFHLRPSDPVPCVGRDAAVTAVTITGSASVAGQAYGPRVMVQRGATTTPLAVDETIAVAATIRTQVMAVANAHPAVLRMRRVHDFVRPGGWIRWPLYAVELISPVDCAVTPLAVSIFGPAPVLPTTATSVTSLATMPGVVVPYAAYYDATDASLVAKSAIVLDAPLTFPWESNTSGQSCVTGNAIPANQVAFLGAMVTGAAVVTHLPEDVLRRPILVFRTRPGQPFKAHASAMVGGNAQTVCHRDDMRPAGVTSRMANAKVAWPATDVTELDVIHTVGFLRMAGEVVASNFTWVASGRSTTRQQAFLEDSDNVEKSDLVAQSDVADGAVVIKTVQGAIPSWSAVNPLFRDRTSLAMVAQTLPESMAAEGVEWACDQAMLNPSCGDRICGMGEAGVCWTDCPVMPMTPPPPGNDGGVDAAGSGSGSSPGSGIDAGTGSGTASGMDAGSGAGIDAGSGSGTGSGTGSGSGF